MEIDDEVFRAAKLRALDTRKTLRQVVDEGDDFRLTDATLVPW